MTPAVDRRPAPRSGPGVMSVSDDNGHLTEIDQRILELNQEGHSTRQISRLLNERYDIKLGRSSVVRHLEELRQDSDNDVRVNFTVTIPTKPRIENKWYKVIERLKTNLEEYNRKLGFKASSRTMDYQLIDEGFLKEKSKSEHKKFIEVTRKARLGWVDSDGELCFQS